MRGGDRNTGALFSYVSCEERVAKDHPLRAIGEITNAALAALSPEFEKLYARLGRPSIAPEKLLRALLLQAFYSVRSERQLMEQLDYNLLFRWFVGLGMDAPIWDVTVFTKNRERLVEGEIASKFMAAVLSQPRVRELLSSEHFSVDGTLIEAWASMKSLRPKDGSGEPPAAGRNSLPRRRPGASAIFTARSAVMRRTPRPAIRTRGSTARGRGRRQSWPIWGTR
jgi:transposase